MIAAKRQGKLLFPRSSPQHNYTNRCLPLRRSPVLSSEISLPSIAHNGDSAWWLGLHCTRTPQQLLTHSQLLTTLYRTITPLH